MIRLYGFLASALAAAVVVVPSGAWAEDPAPPSSTQPSEVTASPSAEPTETATPTAVPTSGSTQAPTPTEAVTATPGATAPTPQPDPEKTTATDSLESVTENASGVETTIAAAKLAKSTAGSGAVTAKITGVKREFVGEDGDVEQVWPSAGGDSEAGAATIEMTVSATTNLRGRQQLDISWSGAHPTGGRSTNPNSSAAAADEYPFVLLQCRGVDTTGSVPTGQVRLSPKTCWTQTPGERTLESSVQWPAWRSDRDAKSAERSRWANSPYDPLGDTKPEGCPAKEQAAVHWTAFEAVDGTSYPGTVAGPSTSSVCGESAPEVTAEDPIGIPSNTTYAATKADGTGTARFTVWSNKENASLGCSADVSCALVAVPIVGISCDEWGHGAGAGTGLPEHDGRTGTSTDVKRYNSTHAPSTARLGDAQGQCSGAEDRYEPGSRRSSAFPNAAVAGNLWWSASNWKHRITVPLKFAVSPDVCSVVSHDVPQSLYGSLGFTEVAQSWQPTFCTSSTLFTFNHVQAPDSNARTLLNTGGSELALTTQERAGGYDRPVTRAPIAASGFAIAFNADDKSELPAAELKLNARLLAKLLTESYSVNTDIRVGYSAPSGSSFEMRTQPFNLLVDPEFQALNPEFNPARGNWSPFEAASALQILGADADLMWALTSYIANDTDAADWLAGDPDPWGMRVNPSYKVIELPVENWPLLDDWPSKDPNASLLFPSQSYPCYQAGTPYLPLVHNQLAAIATVVENLQFAKSAVKTECEGDGGTGTTYRTQGRQPVGSRFVVGLVPLSSAIRYGLPTAKLRTQGDEFVSADEDGLKAAAKLLTVDDSKTGWELDYSKFKTADGTDAYPGFMPLYADVATKDVDAKTAGHLADFLCYAATKGQVSGAANGQLPAGYLPLTAANGLGDQQQQIYAAAAAVRKQAGDEPKLGDVVSADVACPAAVEATPTPTPSPTTYGSTSSSTSSTSTVTTTDAAAAAPADGKAAKGGTPAAGPLVKTVGQHSTLGSVGPLLLLALLFLTAFGGLALQWEQFGPRAISEIGKVVRELGADLHRRRE